MRKGVSISIIVILVLLITVSLILMSYQWLLRYSPQTQWELEKSLVKKEGCLKIENIDTANKKITIRNCGSAELSNFKVYVDEKIIASYSDTLNAGNITQISYVEYISPGDHEIMVSSNYAESPKIIFYNPEEPWEEMFFSGCSVLDKERTIYYLTADILNSGTDYCMNISANNVVLDCQGHIIDGKGTSTFNGIYVFRSSLTTTGITINNCTVTDWATGGITFYRASGNIIKNSVTNLNTDVGIYLSSSTNNQLSNITANSNSNYGIWFWSSSNNQLSNITANSNSNSGVFFYGQSNDNQITNSRFETNLGNGMYYSVSCNLNRVYNNLFNNTNNLLFSGPIVANYWNTTKQTGKRIYSAGIEIGGNYWTNPSKNGYSDTCTDSNKDGFCDNPLNLTNMVMCTSGINCFGNATDYLPLSDEYIP